MFSLIALIGIFFDETRIVKKCFHKTGKAIKLSTKQDLTSIGHDFHDQGTQVCQVLGKKSPTRNRNSTCHRKHSFHR